MALSAASATAHGQQQEPTAVRANSVALNWVRMPGAESCIAPQTLGRSVATRVGGPVFVPIDAADWSIEGRIERRGRAWVPTLSAARAPGEAGARTIERVAPDCAAIDEQIITIIALLLNANAVQPQPQTTPCPTPEPRVVVREVLRAAPPPPERRVVLQPIASRSASIELGLGVGLDRVASPAPAATIAVEWSLRWPLLRLRTGLYFDGPSWTELQWESGRATLTTLGAGFAAALCVASPAAQWLSFCPGARGGFATGTATDTAVLPTAAVDVGVRAELPLSARWALRSWTEASVSFLPSRFAVVEGGSNRVLAEAGPRSVLAISTGLAISLLIGTESR